MTDLTSLTGLLAFLPEPWRGYAHAAAFAFLACITVSSVITAHTPAWAFKRWRPLRIFSFLSGFAPKDGAGTVKLPFTAPLNPGAMHDLRKLQAFADEMLRSGRATPAEITPPSPPKPHAVSGPPV